MRNTHLTACFGAVAFIALMATAYGGGDSSGGSLATISVVNHMHDQDYKNPCPDLLLNSRLLELHKAIDTGSNDQVLSSIQKQIVDKYSQAPDDKKQSPSLTFFPIEIFVVSEEEFIKEYSGDAGNLPAAPTDEDKKKAADHAQEEWNANDAYTYPSNTNKIKIKIFCKPTLVEKISEEDSKQQVRRMVIHELVHAKLLLLLHNLTSDQAGFNGGTPTEGQPTPTHKEDHNPGFEKEVDELFNIPLDATAIQPMSFGRLKNSFR